MEAEVDQNKIISSLQKYRFNMDSVSHSYATKEHSQNKLYHGYSQHRKYDGSRNSFNLNSEQKSQKMETHALNWNSIVNNKSEIVNYEQQKPIIDQCINRGVSNRRNVEEKYTAENRYNP